MQEACKRWATLVNGQLILQQNMACQKAGFARDTHKVVWLSTLSVYSAIASDGLRSQPPLNIPNGGYLQVGRNSRLYGTTKRNGRLSSTAESGRDISRPFSTTRTACTSRPHKALHGFLKGVVILKSLSCADIGSTHAIQEITHAFP